MKGLSLVVTLVLLFWPPPIGQECTLLAAHSFDLGGFSVGINLSALTYWNRELPFVDLFKGSMPWVTQNSRELSKEKAPWDTGFVASIPTDAQGYPLRLPFRVEGARVPQIVATIMCRDIAGHYPGGRYLCLYEGKGEIQFGMDARVLTASQGRYDLLVSPTNAGILIKITRSELPDHIRNIRFIMPGHEQTYYQKPFNPLFLERLRPFRVIRFMDWQRTNNSQTENWSGRTFVESYTQAGESGVAIEYMVDLCNMLGSDPWFCIPHKASREFIQSFSGLVYQRLNPDRRIYLEYSNEVWNPAFHQYRWVNQNGRPGLSHPMKYAELARNAFRTWKEAFGRQENRVIRVIACQLSNPRLAEEIMTHLGPGEADAIAPAAYFGLSPSDYDSLNALGMQASAENILELTGKNLSRQTIPLLKQYASMAKARGMDLLTYEGGQHLVPKPPGTFPPYIKALWQAQTSQMMYHLYVALLNEFKKMGGKLFTAFSFVSKQESPWGSWGHLDHLYEQILDAPKYRALLEFSDLDAFRSPRPGSISR